MVVKHTVDEKLIKNVQILVSRPVFIKMFTNLTTAPVIVFVLLNFNQQILVDVKTYFQEVTSLCDITIPVVRIEITFAGDF